MPGVLKQATAAQSRAIGPFVDDTDFKTPETGLTIANTDIKLVINGAASADKNSGGGTHRVNGVYGITFDATDTATVGEIEVSVNVSGALVVFDKFTVVEEVVYDQLFAASATGYQVPIWAAAGSTVNLSATTIATTQKVDVETIKTNPVVNAGTITFPTTATLASTTNISAATGVDITKILGTAISTPATAGILDVNVKNIDNDAASASGTVTFPAATLASTTNITAATGIDVTKWLGTTVSTPTVAGVPNVNTKTWNDLATVALPLVPTTAGRTLDVSATGEAGVDWANVGSPTTTVGLSGTTVKTATDIATQIGANGAGLTSVGVGTGGIAAVSFAAGAIDATAIAADAIGSSELAATAANKVRDAVTAAACTEPTAVVAASPTLIAAVSWLLTQSRNKITQTATAQTLLADDGSTTIAASTVSDDGTTAVRGEFA